MTLLLISFIAGLLTVLAPCVLPLLPVIVGGSVSDTRSKWKPYIVTGSLAASVVVFTLIIKIGTDFLDIPQGIWVWVAGGILFVFSLTMIFPKQWAKFSHKIGAEKKSNQWLGKASQKKNIFGDVLMGAALGPVFSSCSPTYFVILATVLPQSFGIGLLNLIVYALGLAIVLLAIALIGQKFANKVAVLSDPDGWFKKTIGVLFLLVAIAIISGFDKQIETWLLDRGLVPSIGIENKLLDSAGIE